MVGCDWLRIGSGSPKALMGEPNDSGPPVHRGLVVVARKDITAPGVSSRRGGERAAVANLLR
jgi:hypothetical protein